MTKAVTILKSEHRSISAVLMALRQLAKLVHDSTVRPEFQVLRAMIRYIDEYPERLHHPKEDQYLFAKLAARAPQAKKLIDELQEEHRQGALLVRELERALLFLEEGWPAGAREFLDACDRYAEFHWQHMRKEEQEIVPLAERFLTAEDWQEVDSAFSGNTDPIADIRERDFQALFSRIVGLAPAPVGLGEPWKKAVA